LRMLYPRFSATVVLFLDIGILFNLRKVSLLIV